MPNHSPVLLTLVLGLLCFSCRAPSLLPGIESEPSVALPLPPSALGGAVRVLETLAAVRPADSLTQVRALQCDTRHDPGSPRSFVRVFLPLTVYASTLERAEAAFVEIRAALEAEAAAGERPALASEARARRVLGDLDWDPPGREDWVSYSDTVRLELTPGREAPATPTEAASTSPLPMDSLESYVRGQAAAPPYLVGQVDLTRRVADPALGLASGVLCRIEPLRSGRYSRLQIAGFLGKLEAGSPAVRLTRLEIERSQEEPDPHSARAWTFGAELTAAAQPAAASSAGVAR